MKTRFATFLVILSALNIAMAGGFGPAPWANGAYYVNQFDGVYTGTVYAPPGTRIDPVSGEEVYTGTVVSGVVGFAISGGSPTGITTQGTNAVGGFDRNFYALFVNGAGGSGPTLANINVKKETVAGVFLPGFGKSYEKSTNAGVVSVIEVPINVVEGGSFLAGIDSDNALFTFSGDGLISTPVAPLAGAPTTPSSGVEFEIYGIKVAN